jgi:PAS domain S-box-containing protein
MLDDLGKMVAFGLLDQRGCFTHVSDHWCEVSRWDREALLGEHWSVALHPDDVEHARETERRSRSGSEIISHESRIVAPDGQSVTPVRSQVTPLTDDNGEVTGWLVVAVDMTESKASEEALRQSERRLQVILDSSIDMVNIINADGSWRATRLGVEWHVDLDDEELASGRWWRAIHPEDWDATMQAFDDILAGKEGAGTLRKFRLLLSEGRTRWIEAVGVNLIDDPAVRGVVVHSRDVTERHLAQEELRHANSLLMALIKNLHLGVLVIDENGTIVGTNQAMLTSLGIDASPDDFMGEHADVALDRFLEVWRDPNVARSRLMGMVKGRRLEPETRFTLSDGRTVAIAFIPIETGGANLGHVWLVRDISGEVALDAEREHLLHIEKQQNARLTELDALKTGLVASVSHELRTPLTSIVSFTQLLRDGLATDSLADQMEFLDIILRNVERLERMVNDLLFLDRIESNTVQVNIEPVNLGQVVSMAVSSILPATRERGIRVRSDISKGPALSGDVDRLNQLVDNLLANAQRYTPDGGQISVRAYPLSEGWQLEIADTGIGIPAEERDRIFERFFRASNARNYVGSGSGLGLAIVRRVVELHCGTVSVAANGDSGTRFTVVLRGVQDPNVLLPRRPRPRPRVMGALR